MTFPIVAIIGLPNTGKSTFFNKVLGRRTALTHPEAGTTRDRAYGLTSWNGLDFYLVDTAGLTLRPDSDLEKNIQRQTAIAKEEADLILLMVDGKTPVSNRDLVVAHSLTKSKKPVLLTANKIDVRNQKTQQSAAEYLKLGLGEPYPVSSVNGSGIGDLLDELVNKLRPRFQIPDSRFQPEGLKIAFVGKPNVGKSSLINALLKDERLLVHHEAGTTRSSVEIPFTYNNQQLVLLDTAGIKKKWQQDSDIAAAAAFQAIRVIARTDLAIFVLDAAAELTTQDQAIAQELAEQQKAALIVLNKIDLISQSEQAKLLDNLPHYFSYLWWVPVVFTSSKTGQGLDLMLEFVSKIYQQYQREISQAELDVFLDKFLSKNQPGKISDQRAPKVYNLKQLGVKPPSFKLSVNLPQAFAPAWKKLLEKQLRLRFGLEGSPIIINLTRKT